MNNKKSSWHSNPLFFADWFNKKWPGRKQELYKMVQETEVVDWKKKYEEMKLCQN